MSQFGQHLPNWFPVGGIWRIALKLFQRPNNAQARAAQLAELMIEISSAR
jgi:hypothetical protein